MDVGIYKSFPWKRSRVVRFKDLEMCKLNRKSNNFSDVLFEELPDSINPDKLFITYKLSLPKIPMAFLNIRGAFEVYNIVYKQIKKDK